MKVLIVTNTSLAHRDGDFHTLRDEVGLSLKEKGHKVEYFQFRTKAYSGVHTFDLIKNGFKVSTAKFFRPKILGYLFAYLKGMWRLLFNDFVYIYYPNNFMLLGPVAKLMGKDYGIYLRGSVGIDAKFSKFIFKHAKVVFCVSPIFTKLVNDAGGRGIDKKPTISFSYEDIVQDREYKEKEKYNILYLGRTDKDKGLFELIDAIKVLKTKQNKFKVDIVGDGLALEELKNKVKEKDVEDVVTFHGAIMDKEKIKDIFLDADIYILPTYHEGFARTLCEAMLFGVPIITTFVGGIPGYMKENLNSLRIEPKSVTSIIEKLTYSMNNYMELVEYAKNGTKDVSEILNPNKLSHGEKLSEYLN